MGTEARKREENQKYKVKIYLPGFQDTRLITTTTYPDAGSFETWLSSIQSQIGAPINTATSRYSLLDPDLAVIEEESAIDQDQDSWLVLLRQSPTPQRHLATSESATRRGDVADRQHSERQHRDSNRLEEVQRKSLAVAHGAFNYDCSRNSN